MTSLLSQTKQTADDNQYYINIGSLYGKILSRNAEGSNNTGLVGGTFSTASWSFLAGGAVLSTMLTAGGVILKDMGRTVVSSLRTFRKIQLVLPASASTFGVGGRSGTVAGASGEDYYTGYIELGFEGNGTPAPVAKFGR